MLEPDAFHSPDERHRRRRQSSPQDRQTPRQTIRVVISGENRLDKAYG
jgi:hypothetical protein